MIEFRSRHTVHAYTTVRSYGTAVASIGKKGSSRSVSCSGRTPSLAIPTPWKILAKKQTGTLDQSMLNHLPSASFHAVQELSNTALAFATARASQWRQLTRQAWKEDRSTLSAKCLTSQMFYKPVLDSRDQRPTKWLRRNLHIQILWANLLQGLSGGALGSLGR